MFITYTGRTYEEAMEKAKRDYGLSFYVHSIKNVNTSRFLGLAKNSYCEITCIVKDLPHGAEEKKAVEDKALLERFEKEAQTPDPENTTAHNIDPNG